MPFDGAHLNPTAAHLLRAKEYLRKQGWSCAGAHGNGGTVCMAVAVNSTYDPTQVNGRWLAAYRALALAIGISPEDRNLGVRIGHWNDHVGRTYDEVLGAFDKAIELAVEDGTGRLCRRFASRA